MDRAPDKPKVLATAGSDHAVHIFDRDSSRITHNLVGHSKKVTGGSTLLSLLSATQAELCKFPCSISMLCSWKMTACAQNADDELVWVRSQTVHLIFTSPMQCMCKMHLTKFSNLQPACTILHLPRYLTLTPCLVKLQMSNSSSPQPAWSPLRPTKPCACGTWTQPRGSTSPQFSQTRLRK